ncbi:MAG: cysteine-rich CWC family protein [Bacteroidetes bacterium]|nr:cysteine-rich CWC family protein [Bacteroidota bacterium]
MNTKLHETKTCSRCGAGFECKPGNITQCQCFNLPLSDEQKAYIEMRYNDCLCRNCLIHLSSELNFFIEKYIYK